MEMIQTSIPPGKSQPSSMGYAGRNMAYSPRLNSKNSLHSTISKHENYNIPADRLREMCAAQAEAESIQSRNFPVKRPETAQHDYYTNDMLMASDDPVRQD